MLEIEGLIKDKKLDSTKFSEAIFKIENKCNFIYKNLVFSINLNKDLYIKDNNIFVNKKLLKWNKELCFEIKEIKRKSGFIVEFEIGIKKDCEIKELDVRVQIMGLNSEGRIIVKDIIGYIKNENIKEENIKEENFNINVKQVSVLEKHSYKKEKKLNLDEKLIKNSPTVTEYVNDNYIENIDLNKDFNENKIKIFIETNKDKIKINDKVIYETVIINGSEEAIIFMYKLYSCDEVYVLNRYIVDEKNAYENCVSLKLEPNCGISIKNMGIYKEECNDCKLWAEGILNYKFIKNNKIDKDVFELRTEKVFLEKI